MAVVFALATAFVALRVYPHDLPPAGRHPDLLAAVLYSRAMIFTGRLTLLCLAAFAILSIAARVVQREWLAKAGPFEVERAAESASDLEEARRDLAAARAEVRELRARTARYDAMALAYERGVENQPTISEEEVRHGGE